jgi:hypothetical protein
MIAVKFCQPYSIVKNICHFNVLFESQSKEKETNKYSDKNLIRN